MSEWKNVNKHNILKTSKEQTKAVKKILKEVREDIEKRNGKSK